MKVDVVYTWVDGGDPDYQELLRKYSDDPVDLNPERFRDHYQMLRYSLRSLAQFASDWIGRIFVVTCRPQTPPWLNTDHPDVRVIHHDEFFSDPSVLPTFSCLPIETQLHRIPCSDPFLYFNDDYMLGAPASPELFVDNTGRIRVFGTLVGERFPWRIRQDGISLGFTEHTPIWVDKRSYQATNKLFRSLYLRTLGCKFRQGWNFRMERAYRYYLLAHTRNRVVVPFWTALREVGFHKITNQPARQQRLLSRLLRRRPALLCLNDDQRDHPDPQVVSMVQSFLQQYYPQPSPWEKL